MPTSSESSFPLEISVEEAANWLLRGGRGEPIILLDVREPHELEICQIAGAIHIPLKQLSQRWNELPTNCPIVINCHHGMRSLRAAEFLKEKGLKKVCSMAGGIHAWAEEIDPSLQRY
ncbi:MAG: rhodanese-like domain-containing protein [Verrucomicrobiota bacterium]|nr:rhodanese-like domain-containing protein [Verrucomicrobiota bacterium]